MAKVVSVTFGTCSKCGKPYYFAPPKFEVEKGDHVVVETQRGIEFATVVEPDLEVAEEAITPPLMPVIRIATERDEEAMRRANERRGEAMEACREKIRAHNLAMKLIDCEFAFDGSRVVFTFSAENRVDFRELVKDLASYFHMRIELRQVGARDETKILGGIAPCGRVVCCASCMPEFGKVSIKMAKNQGLSLNPGKISGLCGRLMCCLAYENEYYASVYKQMPKIGAEVDTPEGKGNVVTVNMLKLTVRVKIEKDGALVYRDFPLDDLKGPRGAEEEGEEAEPSEEPVLEEKLPAEEEKPSGSPAREERQNTNNDRRKQQFHGNKKGGQNGNRPQNGAKNEGASPKKNNGHNRHQGGNRPNKNAPKKPQ